MKRMLAILLGMVLLGGCAPASVNVYESVAGKWYCVEREGKTLNFNELLRKVYTEDHKNWPWYYDSETQEYVIMEKEVETKLKMTVVDGKDVLLMDDIKFVREQDYAGFRSEFLSVIAKAKARDWLPEERLPKLIDDYRREISQYPVLKVGTYDSFSCLEYVYNGLEATMEDDGLRIYASILMRSSEERSLWVSDQYSNNHMILRILDDVGSIFFHANHFLLGQTVEYGKTKVSPSKSYNLKAGIPVEILYPVAWYPEDYGFMIDERMSQYGISENRENVLEALREAKLPIAYALVDTAGEVWLMDLTEILEAQGKS